jgi:hypothetical protein
MRPLQADVLKIGVKILATMESRIADLEEAQANDSQLRAGSLSTSIARSQFAQLQSHTC